MLRRIYNKVSLTHPDMPSQLRLALSVKAMNDTAGPNGLVPLLLLFGVIPRLPGDDSVFPDQTRRLEAIETARQENGRIVVQSRVRISLRKQPPHSANYRFLPQQPVYLYREKERCWTGPHLVISSDEKNVRVDLGERTGPRSFNISQVKPTKLPSITELLQYQPPETTKDNEKPSPIHAYYQAPFFVSPRVLLTEIISPRDPRNSLFDEAKRKEIEGLLNRGTFKLVLRSEIDGNPNTVPSRFVLTIKRQDNGEEVYKARFVLGGHRDRDKRSVVHNATNLRQSSIRILLALATILGFNMWSTDINQAYLQSASNLKRETFVKPEIMALDKVQLLQVVKPLYGLSDAGEYWGQTLNDHHTQELKMAQSTGYFSLFYKRLMSGLTGLSGTYVDDIIRAGDGAFREESTKLTDETFDT
jgi:Reverse transcriptase (RNA-dependent DNA polymerase)